MSWFVYIIQSTVNGKLYTGITVDLLARLYAHNAGKGAKATRAGRPWLMVYQARVESKGDALREEARIKKLTRDQKLTLLASRQTP